MSHIEFLGPPGAGKSTINTSLIKLNEIYGGTEEDAVRRYFATKGSRQQRMLYRLLPRFVSKVLDDELLKYRLGHSALEDFVQKHPEFIADIHYAMDAVLYEPEKVFSQTRRAAEQYQLGISTVTNREKLCLDDGFIQRTVTILWRNPVDSFSIDRFFQNLPCPDTLIYVTAPPEQCLARQQERDNIIINKDWEDDDLIRVQNRVQSVCEDIRDRMSERTSVIEVENTGSVESAVEKIRTELTFAQ